MQLTTTAIDALQHVHTATNDVLEGYHTMAERAQPDLRPVIHRLIVLHERQAAEQAALLRLSAEGEVGDTSLQATVNKAVVILRDWFTDLDRDALPAVRQGEQALREVFAKALRDEEVATHEAVGPLLKTQLAAIDREILTLPQR